MNSRRAGLAGVLVLLLTATLAPVSGLLSAPASAAPVPSAQQLQRRAEIVFDKNWRNPFRSRIVWKAWTRKAGGKWRLVERASWRAGSGLGGVGGRQECRRNVGWTPNGRYSFVQLDHRRGNYINGRVFALANKRCRNGTLRQNMFIHSEQTRANTQCPDRRGDQSCRWEYPRINDYRSNGCIKMAPGALRALTDRYHRWFRAGVRYPTSVVQVRVVR